MTYEPSQHIINGISILAYDEPGSLAATWIADEVTRDCYGLSRIAFAAGDIVVDIGAHIGLLSIYLAKQYPFLTIFAFEPFPINFSNCRRNLALNEITSVQLSNEAITCDGRELTLAQEPRNTASASAIAATQQPYGAVSAIRSITLDEVFRRHQIERCKLLKIDCEGLEYEILYHTDVLDKIEHLSGEFHMNSYLAGQGYTPQHLYTYCEGYLSHNRLNIEANQIWD
jgi:FkbM family methyltransferase